MIQYDIDNVEHFNSKSIKSSESLFQNFKDNITFTKKIKQDLQKKSEVLILKIALIPGLISITLLSYLFSTIPKDGNYTFITNWLVNFGMGTCMTMLGGLILGWIYSDIKLNQKIIKWENKVFRFFKSYRKLDDQILLEQYQILELLKDIKLQKELVLYLKELEAFIKNNKQHSNISEDLSYLISLLSQDDYLKAKEHLMENLEIWDNLKIHLQNNLEKQALINEKKNQYLKKINIEPTVITQEIFEKEINLKNLL